MESFKTYLEESTVNAETVKRGIVYFINDSLQAASVNAATIQIGKHKIQNVVAAKPATNRSTGGIVPYVDIELVLANGNKVDVAIRVAKSKKFFVYRGKSLRNAGVPALFNGIHSLDKMYPEVREHYVSSVLDYYRTKGYDHGTEVPTVYGKVEGEMKEKILLGDSKHGGKLDYLIAIDRAPLTWKRMRIPTMKTKFKGNEYVIDIGNARAFNASEIMANNDVYVWASKKNNRLYLGNDRLDQNNLPAVFGPPRGDDKEYGIHKYRVGINVDTKESIVLKDNSRVFKLELKNPTELEGTTQNIAANRTASMDQTPSEDRGYQQRSGYGRSKVDVERDKEEYGETLSPDAREEIIKKIVDAAERGMRHRFKINLDREQLETIGEHLDDLDDFDLKRMSTTPPHRLATEIKKDYL